MQCFVCLKGISFNFIGQQKRIKKIHVVGNKLRGVASLGVVGDEISPDMAGIAKYVLVCNMSGRAF